MNKDQDNRDHIPNNADRFLEMFFALFVVSSLPLGILLVIVLFFI